MRRLWLPMLLLALSACATSPSGNAMKAPIQLLAGSLPDLGPAPELNNAVWLNTPAPLHLADLRGKVVGVEMWTFDCINCQHTLPTLNGWYKKYKDQGLVIIGNHF